MDRIFLDANVLYAAAYTEGTSLRRLWELKGAELWTSTYAAAEAVANLAEDRPARVEELQRLLDRVHVEAGPPAEASLPAGIDLAAKDRPVLAAAIEAKATHLVTGDKTHFGPYFGRTVGGVMILTPSEYLRSRL